MTAGRPSIYEGEATVAKVQEYLDSCTDTNEQVVKQENEEKGYVMYENKLRVRLPTVDGLAVFLGVSRETIYAWKKTYAEFSDIIEKLQATQADRLINKGISGDYNPTISKVLLTKHGYIEKQAVDLTTHDDEPSDDELAEVIRGSFNGSQDAAPPQA